MNLIQTAATYLTENPAVLVIIGAFIVFGCGWFYDTSKSRSKTAQNIVSTLILTMCGILIGLFFATW